MHVDISADCNVTKVPAKKPIRSPLAGKYAIDKGRIASTSVLSFAILGSSARISPAKLRFW